MKIAAVVVLYHPGEDLKRNVLSYISEVSKVYVVDNTESNSKSNEDKLSSLNTNIHYIRNNQNLGIAKALNQGIEAALNDHFEWLLTMDQDSYFSDNSFFQAVRGFSDLKNVAIYTQKFAVTPIPTQNFNYKEIDGDKASGNIINLAICQKIGGFQDDLFIDDVDTEYCYRIKKYGYKIILYENIYLIHEVGQSYRTKSLFTGKEFYRNEHSPIRYYYITRNLLIVSFKYLFIFPGKTIKNLVHFPRFIYGIVVYEKNRRKKLYFVLKGLYHFIIGKKGPFKQI